MRTGWFDGLDNPRPVWIPKKYIIQNNQKNYKYHQEAKLHPFLFRDSIWSQTKQKGIKRIAVLGDSFIWGDGIPQQDIWSHILREKILKENKNIEVLSWGQNGWSTADEFNFLKTHGYKFNIDMLLFGFVTNDPDFGNVIRHDFTWQNDPEMKIFKIFFPNLFDFAAAHINNFLQKSFVNMTESFFYRRKKI